MQSVSNIQNDLIDRKENKLTATLQECIDQAWNKIAPSWPLKHLIAVNPLQGLEDLPFEKAMMEGFAYFQDQYATDKMMGINRETIKWCQAFFDEGQATINMPFRHLGLYQSFRHLAQYDKKLHRGDKEHIHFLAHLPQSPEELIPTLLTKLHIPDKHQILFLSLLLTTLPGWASYIKYRIEWAHESNNYHPVSKADYLAIRLILTYILWPDALELAICHNAYHKNFISEKVKEIVAFEDSYQKKLLGVLLKHSGEAQEKCEIPNAQLIFCIDVRSEPFRRAIETQGHYETFGCAGFFGIPVQIENGISGESRASCPVLLKPKHSIKEHLNCSEKDSYKILRHTHKINTMKRVYQNLKYTFTTPLMLVEVMGFWMGLWMLLRTCLPTYFLKFKQKMIFDSSLYSPCLTSPIDYNDKNGISFSEQCRYAESALRMIGLTDHFAPLVVLCGHGSSTQNNSYATALDCGACGGHHGDSNARILAIILNDMRIRNFLIESGIHIPQASKFVAAKHNTTTDSVSLYMDANIDATTLKIIDQLKIDLNAAREMNNTYRSEQLGNVNHSAKLSIKNLEKRSLNWAETRPEWGLARYAAFIVGPRHLTKSINLEGRAFLHSYNWEEDKDGTCLTTILTAPMIVAQWINSQYLFSSLDNVTYGSGSKVTHNITGKIGIMQGNGSDLMHGLPLQSLYSSDANIYHQPVRLTAIIYAPRTLISAIISVQPILQKLLANGWITLISLEAEKQIGYLLERDLSWKTYA